MNLCKTEQEYINAISLAARRACKRYGYLPSVLIAQSCLENGYAIEDYADNPSLKLLIKYNNGVGLKSELLSSSWSEYSVWNGESLSKETPEEYNGKKVTITDSFRKYDTMERSFADFLLFLTYASNYGKGGTPKYGKAVLSIKDPETLIKRVSALGYATDSQYSVSVMKIIRKHNLTKYDDLSGVEPTIYTPGYKSDSKKESTMEKIKIIDITSQNTPPRWGNTREALVFHFLGVAAADNPYLYGGGYGGQWYISRKGEIYHAVKEGGTVWAVGSGGWGLKTTVWSNSNTESVEMGCENDNGSDSIYDKKWWFHMATQEAAVKLARYWLEMRGYGVSEASVNKRILIHNTITNKPCPAPWLHGAGYCSPREKGHRNWSFEEFKKKIWQGYNGNTSEGGDDVTETKWYRVRKSWSDESSQLGAYVSLDNAKANCPTGYAVYDWNGKEIYMNKPETLTKTQTQFLNAVKAVCDLARKEGWKYGDSRTSVPCLDKIISCDRMVARALYNLGFKDQRIGGEVCTTLPTYLVAHGWKATTSMANIKPGAIVAVRNKNTSSIDHVFVVTEYNAKTGYCSKYDCGSKSRIDSTQPFKNVKLMEWANKVFVAAWNVPDKFEPDVIDAQPDEEITPKKTTTISTVYKGVNYSPVYNYTYYRKKYADLREKYGTDKQAYFDHFCKWGMKEGRKACATFDVNKYRKRYVDLQKAFGNDLPAYYKHFVVYGKKEGRNGK